MNDIWAYLCQTEKPIVMYGTGNGADKIFSVLDSLNIEVQDIFASDGFVRNRYFHGKKVISYAEAAEKYRNEMIILLAFGSDRPEVIENFYGLSEKHELYAPDVPVVGKELFDFKFYEQNIEKIKAARELFYDEESKNVYDSIINYRLSGRIEYLSRYTTDISDVMQTVLHPKNYIYSLDLGAFTGDTAISLLSYAKNIKKIIAVEPDQKNYQKLLKNAEYDERIEPHLSAAWNKFETLIFSRGGGRAIKKSAEGKTAVVSAAPSESFLEGRMPDFIKIDVEGSEREAIEGCLSSIKTYAPELQIALYHRSRDIFEIPILIYKINPAYKMYLRKFSSVPAWDINLFCIK